MRGKKKPVATSAAPARAAASPQKAGITAAVTTVSVQPGLYLFSVRAGSPSPANASGLRLPSLHVTIGPGVAPERVEFIPSQSANGTWLAARGDLLVTKVHAPGATLVMSSMRNAGGPELAVKFEKLEPRDASTAPAAPAQAPVPAQKAAPGGLRLQVGAHIRLKGDLTFVDTAWAGRLGKGLWLESFSVAPLERFTRQDIEYKGLTASGFESPWLSNGVACGTRGMAIPLIGFAVRLKAGVGGGEYDCEYSGYFQSGVVVGPLRNGTPCRSTVANDPLEGLQVRIVRKGGAESHAKAAVTAKPRTAPAKPARAAAAPARKAPAKARRKR